MSAGASTGPSRIPWYDYYSTAVNVFGVPFDRAWAMTPHEFWALYDRKFPKRIEPVSRTEFDEWAKRFPD